MKPVVGNWFQLSDSAIGYVEARCSLGAVHLWLQLVQYTAHWTRNSGSYEPDTFNGKWTDRLAAWIADQVADDVSGKDLVGELITKGFLVRDGDGYRIPSTAPLLFKARRRAGADFRDDLDDEPAVARRYWLYRLWDDNNRLIYVGVTVNLDARLATHRRKMKGLWTRYTLEEHPTAESMLAAEIVAIQNEFPAMNVRDV